jgi:hypothetical protein
MTNRANTERLMNTSYPIYHDIYFQRLTAELFQDRLHCILIESKKSLCEILEKKTYRDLAKRNINGSSGKNEYLTRLPSVRAGFFTVSLQDLSPRGRITGG